MSELRELGIVDIQGKERMNVRSRKRSEVKQTLPTKSFAFVCEVKQEGRV